MKKITLLLISSLLIIDFSYAQGENENNGFAFGFSLSQHQKDFGFDINATSPFFINDVVAIRLRSKLMFYEHVENEETVWTPYSNVSFGVISSKTNLGGIVNLYSEGGVLGIFPSEKFSSEGFVFGGYGLFGFEFLIDESKNYFLEIGGIGTGAKANKIENIPIYSNGFLINVGFRIIF